MAFDTKYRPVRYSDVLGQDATVAVLKQFVRSGAGFHQSYLFSGPHGSGKTSLGRILARALMCDNPQDGEPCDECSSCRSILERGSSENFTEMDAATKSGKEHIRKITEELQYATFSGKRRIYLFDEAHQLTPGALDALLKPMEDSVPGTQDKYLVCIFCTTEPHKMRATVFSRCAPAFTIRVVPPEIIAQRLAWIADQEGIAYEMEALVAISEATESHIRDAIKTLEGVSQLGAVTMENVNRYLRLDINEKVLSILSHIGRDVGKAMEIATEVCQVVSPSSVYQRLSESAMLAYQSHTGVSKAPRYWKREILDELGEHHKGFLVTFAGRFASRPGKPTVSMLQMDIAYLHLVRSGTQPVVTTSLPVVTTNVPTGSGSTAPENTSKVTASSVQGKMEANSRAPETPQRAYETEGGVYVDPRAVRRRKSRSKTSTFSGVLTPETFREFLGARVLELRSGGAGSTGRYNVGGPGTDQER